LGRLQRFFLRPHSLRRSATRFFDKIRKLDPTVKHTQRPRPPGLPPRRSTHAVPEQAGLTTVVAVLVGLAAWLPGLARAQPPAVGSIYQRGERAAPAERAERIVAASLSGLGNAASFSARVRQLARVGDTVLKGGGRYLQSGLGEEQRFRFESLLSADTEEFEVLEVCDGIFAWSYRRLGPGLPTVERVDIRSVRDRLETLGVKDQACVSPYLGGVQRTLALVREWFTFVSVSAAAVDDVPVWSIEGRWNRDRLAAHLPDQAKALAAGGEIAAADLPEGVPWGVRLSVSQRELFPFRIEWLAIPGRRPVAARPAEVVAVLELYDVRIGEPVDATAFVYKPAIEGLSDTTSAAVQQVAPLRP
jgi:hypothetical protein